MKKKKIKKKRKKKKKKEKKANPTPCLAVLALSSHLNALDTKRGGCGGALLASCCPNFLHL
ncbi:hypothetical protein E2C01_043307 [Portunus trituberculatus]|uniref:Uncharacterized protein n=1 Tax=Portunus trituberculatus TaxID=210409 RepID=A0A5B7FZ71_PORTR|nr:hypothetical protein [Portunus trituberculatus]